jgi:hypothetical protein
MADFILTPNMSLPEPIQGVTQSPNYGIYINSSLSILDGHNHAPGSGVQITPSGLNLNAPLSFQNNSLFNVAAVTMFPQLADAVSDSIYVKGVDLYYKDGNANVIRMTSGGAVFATSSGISNGTATATFVSGTLVVQSNTNVAANIDVASVVLRNTSPGSFGLTLSPPALGSNYTLTLPTLPGTTGVMVLSPAGNMGTVTYDAVGTSMTSVGANSIANVRTRALANGSTAPLGGVAYTNSLNFSTNSATPVAVTGATAALTTSGRPVSVTFMPDVASGVAAYVGGSNTTFSPVGAGGIFIVLRNGTEIGRSTVTGQFPLSSGTITVQSLSGPGAINVVDLAPPAGVNTYSLSAQEAGFGATNNATIAHTVMVVYEL